MVNDKYYGNNSELIWDLKNKINAVMTEIRRSTIENVLKNCAGQMAITNSVKVGICLKLFFIITFLLNKSSTIKKCRTKSIYNF